MRNKLFYFGSFNYPGDAREGAELPRCRAVVYRSRRWRHEQPGHDRHSRGRGEDQLPAERQQPLRRVPVQAAVRQTEPRRRRRPRTQDSDSKELDTFLIAQLSYNVILSDRMFLDSKVSYNNTHFPLLQKTDLQPITDSTTNVLYRNRASSQLMFRRRLQVVSNWQYYLPEFAGGRHEFKAGFDNGYTPEDVDTTARGRRRRDVHERRPTPRATTVPDLQHAVASGTRRDEHGALRARTRITLEAADGHRRHPMGADRRVPARPAGPGEPVLPRRAGLPGRNIDGVTAGLHRAESIRRRAREPALVQLGTARGRDIRHHSAKAGRSRRSRMASISIRSTQARRPIRTRTSTRPTSGTT